MKKIPLPSINPMRLFKHCVSSIERNAELKTKLKDGKREYKNLAKQYKKNGERGVLYNIQPLIPNTNDAVAAFEVTKKQFIRLYEYNFMEKNRHIYDALKISTNDQCPFCGGIGATDNLDHYLPKTHFPQYAILPYNLIPACRDCNMGTKGSTFATQNSDQVIHPYLDKNCFFDEQWIKATVIEHDGNVTIDYVVEAPTSWTDTDRTRAEKHYTSFGLARKYRKQAAIALTTLVDQRKGFMARFPPGEFKEFLLDIANGSLPPNHWKRVLYQALAQSDWFCEYDFKRNVE